jgi:adenine deaminase
MKPEVEIYDTTLRDGSQGEGVNFSVVDKLRIAEKLDALMAAARSLGCKLDQPFMALSFLSLSVIGKLKLTHHGLIDVERFEPIDLIVR